MISAAPMMKYWGMSQKTLTGTSLVSQIPRSLTTRSRAASTIAASTMLKVDIWPPATALLFITPNSLAMLLTPSLSHPKRSISDFHQHPPPTALFFITLMVRES
jgi:hypothetical protein